MGHAVTGSNIGAAWLGAFDEIVKSGGQLVNLAVDIADPCTEDLGVRAAIEDALAAHHDRGTKVQSVHTVANTIFPISLYRPGADGAAERFIANAQKAEQVRGHARLRSWGSYIGRLVAYPARDGGTTDQLSLILGRLREETHWADVYEMPIAAEGDELLPCWEGERPGDLSAGAILHGDVRTDALRRGGPCLAHVSVTLSDGRVSMLALYRRHSYIARAYGNFLGLARLLAFLAAESGNQVGSLMVVTGHAVPDLTGSRDLLAAAKAAAAQPSPIEVGARKLGASWSDLELPARSA